MRPLCALVLPFVAWLMAACTDDFGIFDPGLYDASVPPDGALVGGGGGGGGGGGAAGGGGSGGSGGGGGSPRDAGGGDAGPSDAGIPPTCADASACLPAAVPDGGWQLVAFALDASASCPQADFTSVSLIGNPTPTPTACECTVGCDPTGEHCGQAQVNGFRHKNNNCGGTPDFSGQAPAGGGCVRTDVLTGASAYSLAVDPPPVQGNVTCDAGVGGTQDFDASTDLLCAPTAACQADFCGLVAQGFAPCIVAQGDVPCPPGVFATVRRVAGTGATVSCSSSCTCSTNAGSCAATYKAFGSGVTDCSSNQVASGNGDGTCQQNLASGGAIGSVSVAVTHTSGTCKGGGAATADAGLTGIQTLCCPQ